MFRHLLLCSFIVQLSISPSFCSRLSFCGGTDSSPVLQVRTETTADLNVLHERKSKSAVEEHERHVEGKHSLCHGFCFIHLSCFPFAFLSGWIFHIWAVGSHFLGILCEALLWVDVNTPLCLFELSFVGMHENSSKVPVCHSSISVTTSGSLLITQQ